MRNIYIQPPFLARKIEEEVNKLIWEQCPDIRQDERVFVGRDTEIERLREKYLQRNLKDRKAVIVSGIPDRKSTRLNSSHITRSRMPSSA